MEDRNFVSEGEKNRGGVVLIALGFLALIAVAAILLYVHSRTYDVTIAVAKKEWKRVIHVEVYQVVHKDVDDYQIPDDAYNIVKYQKLHHVPKWCKIFGLPYDCGPDVPYNMARYDINRWLPGTDQVTSGDSTQEVVWPTFDQNINPVLGAVRETTRQEIYTVHFVRKDTGATIDYKPPDLQTWQSFAVERLYTMKFTRLEDPLWDTLEKSTSAQ